MKFSIFILLSLLSIATKAQQDYTIEYTIVSGVEFDENNNATYKHKQYGSLYINSDSLSFFKYFKDEVKKREVKKILLKDNMSHHGILRFLKTDSTYENCPIYGKNYLVNHDWRKIINTNWEIFNDTLNVAGYTCTKAVNDSGVVAWFTDSIPINSGPMSYHGLPGVILQINDNRRKQIISAKSITKTSAQIVFPKKYAIVDKEEYKRFVEKNRPEDNIRIYRWSRND